MTPERQQLCLLMTPERQQLYQLMTPERQQLYQLLRRKIISLLRLGPLIEHSVRVDSL
jgi:hypothetical protein